jgi:hypothetical protein
MKTKMKRQGSNELPRFAVGALALAATTASSHSATVQITLTGNKISTTGGNELVADLTGDGIADVALSGAQIVNGRDKYVVVSINGTSVSAKWTASYRWMRVWASFAQNGVGTSYRSANPQGGPQSASYLNPITFTDQRINGGSPTEAWLQVNAFNTSASNHTVELSRLIFDDASVTRPAFATIPGVQTEFAVVPEPSSFALLALGAGGLLARRRRAKAA